MDLSLPPSLALLGLGLEQAIGRGKTFYDTRLSLIGNVSTT